MCSVRSLAGSRAGRAREDLRVVVSRARDGEALNLVVESQEPLTGQIEAVVGLQLAVGDVDEDPFLEIEQLEHGQGVAFAVNGAEVVARECELGSRGQDEVVLPGGTACLTDAGMCGPIDSILGVRTDQVLRRFLTQMPVRFDVAAGPVVVHGAMIDVDDATGRATAIRRLREQVDA